MSFFPHAPLLRQVGQSGLLGGGASVPGPRLNTGFAQRSADPVGYSPNLASVVSFRIFSYCGERRPSRGAGPPLTSPQPLAWILW